MTARERHADKYIFIACLVLAAAMFVGGFFCPPMAETNDSAYNFGNIKTAVNPRLTDTSEVYELYPIDSTHPQEAGYGQMADEIFSCLCYIFNK